MSKSKDKSKDKYKENKYSKYQQLYNDLQKTNQCGKYLKKGHDYAVWPLKQFKKSPIYGGMRDIAEKNRDYVFLAKVIAIVVTVGLLYYLYTVLTRGAKPLFTLDALTSRLKTMNASDLPMSEHINTKAEIDALNCHKTYFNQNPYSIENTGFYDIARGVIFMVITVFLQPAILIFAVIYLLWFLANYLPLIIKAIFGFLKDVFVPYSTRYIVCKVADVIPMFSYGCPNLYKYLTNWRKKYIDEPIYKEKMKYFKFYYLNKKRFYEKPKIKYFDQNWEKGQIHSQYADKFLTRTKGVFFEKVIDSQNFIEQKNKDIKKQTKKHMDYANKKYHNVKQYTDQKYKDISNLDMQESWNKAEKKVNSMYSTKNLLLSLLLLLLSLGILYFFTYYNITGKPLAIFEAIGPLYRSRDLGGRLQFLSSKYNLLKISLIIGLVGILFYQTYQVYKQVESDN